MSRFGDDDRDERDEDDLGDDIRSDLQRSFAAFDAGELNESNAHTLELKAARERGTTDNTRERAEAGSANGAAQGERGRQQSKPDSSPATGGEQTSGERARDQSGRFAKAPEQPGDKPSPGAQQQQPATQQPPEKPQAPAQQTAPDPSRPPAPASFSDAGRKAWANMPPEIRRHMADTEARYQAELKPYAESIAPVAQAAGKLGIDWREGLERLVHAQNRLDQNPQAALIWLAQAYNVNLDELADLAAGHVPANANQQQPGVLPPQVDQRLRAIETAFTRQQQAQQQEQLRQQQAAQDYVQREINTFASSSVAPHWARIESDVLHQVPLVRQQMPNASIPEVLKVAYERAAWAHPEVRALMQQDAARAAEAERRQRNGDQTRLARAASIVTSHNGVTPAGMPAQAANGTLRDEIAANWEAWDAARA